MVGKSGVTATSDVTDHHVFLFAFQKSRQEVIGSKTEPEFVAYPADDVLVLVVPWRSPSLHSLVPEQPRLI